MSKPSTSTNAASLIRAGIYVAILSNPILYLTVASFWIDIKNLFGASINRGSVSFSTDDPFIQAMGMVALAGLVILSIGLWKRWDQRKS
jgi:hypothetical protein